MDSPALTGTVQDVPSGSWMQQCLVALSLSGAKVLQASDCGAGEGAGLRGACRAPQTGRGRSHALREASTQLRRCVPAVTPAQDTTGLGSRLRAGASVFLQGQHDISLDQTLDSQPHPVWDAKPSEAPTYQLC